MMYYMANPNYTSPGGSRLPYGQRNIELIETLQTPEIIKTAIRQAARRLMITDIALEGA